MIGRERLRLEHVERRSIEFTGVESGNDVRIDLQITPPSIDQHRPWQQPAAAFPRKSAEEGPVQHAARIGREREQHSQNIGIGEERLELGGAVIAGDTVERLGRAAPASNLIAKRLERLCGGRTQHAEPHHSDADILRGRLGKVLPDFSAFAARGTRPCGDDGRAR